MELTDVTTVEYDRFKKLIMSTDSDNYVALSNNEYEASMGHEYTNLIALMPRWSFLLHTYGNNLPIDELATIFQNGLMMWYVEYSMREYRDAVWIKGYYQKLIASEILPTFYDLVKYKRLFHNIKFHSKKYSDIYGKTDSFKVPESIFKLFEYPSYQYLLAMNRKISHQSFYAYLVGEGVMDDYIYFIKNVVELCEEIMPEIMTPCYDIEYKLKITKPESVVEILIDDELKHLGVIFQRWKIIVEKLSKLCYTFEVDKIFSQDVKDRIVSDLVFYDRFLFRVQEMIFYIIKNKIYDLYGIDVTDNYLETKVVYKSIRALLTGPSKNKLLSAHNESDIIKKGAVYYFT